MRQILASSLFLVPMLFPSASLASESTTGGCAVTQDFRVSTGVIAPRIIQTAEINPLTQERALQLLTPAEVDVALQVDEKGNAKNVQVISSTSPYLNAGVAASVQRYRFSPAKLDNHAIPMDMTLKIDIQR